MMSELRAWAEMLVGAIPGSVGGRVRRAWHAGRLRAIGPAARWGRNTEVWGANTISIGAAFSCMSGSLLVAERGELRIGDRVSVNRNVLINAADGGRIEIGNDVLIGPNVVLRTSDHVFDAHDVPINRQGHSGSTIVIEDDVWLASNVVVVGGVRIGAHSVIAAGAVVTSDVEQWSVAGGVPARLIRKRR